MKERIKQIMEEENLTPSLFADKLNIGRAVISHILNGRNNPSLDVVTRILDTMNYINADWLLSGKGKMRKDAINTDNSESLPSKDVAPTVSTGLFDTNVHSEVPRAIQHATSVDSPLDNTINRSESKEALISASEVVLDHSEGAKKISKIIIYYSNNTFESFNPDHSPL